MDIDKDSLRRNILNAMCDISSRTEEFYEANLLMGSSGFTNLYFVGDIPLGFKPGISDKLLFKKILTDELIDNLYSEWVFGSNYHMAAAVILTRYYWPYYGWCDDKELKNN